MIHEAKILSKQNFPLPVAFRRRALNDFTSKITTTTRDNSLTKKRFSNIYFRMQQLAVRVEIKSIFFLKCRSLHQLMKFPELNFSLPIKTNSMKRSLSAVICLHAYTRSSPPPSQRGESQLRLLLAFELSS